MSAELTQDVFRIVFIDKKIDSHDIIQGSMIFNAGENILLILERDLGIGDKDRRNEGMGVIAFFTPDTLNNEGYEG